LKNPETILSNLLIVAPNPAKANTTIYYNFADGKAVKKIVLVDMLGRTLQEWSPTDNKGTIGLNCSGYAQGQYLVLMKADDKVIENAKLITN
jgi:uncharacterized protein YaiL (DUF2058 family)